MLKFRVKVELGGKTATGVQVPASVVDGLGGSKRPPVNVTINGYSYKSTVASMGGVYMLPISAEHREGAGIGAGDEVEVGLELDTAPREVAVPEDLAKALAGSSKAKEFFDSLSNSHKKAYTYWVESAKKEETRQQRVSKATEMLNNHQTR